MVAPSPGDCGLSPDRLPADADLKAYLSHSCGSRITGTNTAPVYTYTMTFSMVSITEAYSMTGEPLPSILRPTTASLHPSRTDPGQAGAPGTTRPSPLPSLLPSSQMAPNTHGALYLFEVLTRKIIRYFFTSFVLELVP